MKDHSYWHVTSGTTNYCSGAIAKSATGASQGPLLRRMSLAAWFLFFTPSAL
jgi:hypothetical protein